MNEQNSNSGLNHQVNILVKVFSEPKQAFEVIKNTSTWVFPIILSLVFSIIFMYSTIDIQKELQKTTIMQNERIPEEYKDKALEDMEKPSFFRDSIMPAISGTIITFVFPLFIALVLFVFGNFIFGGKSTYKINFAAACWAGMIGLVEMIIKLPLILHKESMEIYTSLALLMDASQSKTFLFMLLNMVDLFSIWKIIVYATAFMVIYNFSKQKSYATIIALFVVASLIGFGFNQIFS